MSGQDGLVLPCAFHLLETTNEGSLGFQRW